MCRMETEPWDTARAVSTVLPPTGNSSSNWGQHRPSQPPPPQLCSLLALSVRHDLDMARRAQRSGHRWPRPVA